MSLFRLFLLLGVGFSFLVFCVSVGCPKKNSSRSKGRTSPSPLSQQVRMDSLQHWTKSAFLSAMNVPSTVPLPPALPEKADQWFQGVPVRADTARVAKQRVNFTTNPPDCFVDQIKSKGRLIVPRDMLIQVQHRTFQHWYVAKTGSPEYRGGDDEAADPPTVTTTTTESGASCVGSEKEADIVVVRSKSGYHLGVVVCVVRASEALQARIMRIQKEQELTRVEGFATLAAVQSYQVYCRPLEERILFVLRNVDDTTAKCKLSGHTITDCETSLDTRQCTISHRPRSESQRRTLRYPNVGSILLAALRSIRVACFIHFRMEDITGTPSDNKKNTAGTLPVAANHHQQSNEGAIAVDSFSHPSSHHALSSRGASASSYDWYNGSIVGNPVRSNVLLAAAAPFVDAGGGGGECNDGLLVRRQIDTLVRTVDRCERRYHSLSQQYQSQHPGFLPESEDIRRSCETVVQMSSKAAANNSNRAIPITAPKEFAPSSRVVHSSNSGGASLQGSASTTATAAVVANMKRATSQGHTVVERKPREVQVCGRPTLELTSLEGHIESLMCRARQWVERSKASAAVDGAVRPLTLNPPQHGAVLHAIATDATAIECCCAELLGLG